MKDKIPTANSPGILNKLFSHLLGNDKRNFQEVQIDENIIEEIINIAKESHPNEFAALLEGKIKDHVLKIQGIQYLHPRGLLLIVE